MGFVKYQVHIQTVHICFKRMSERVAVSLDDLLFVKALSWSVSVVNTEMLQAMYEGEVSVSVATNEPFW